MRAFSSEAEVISILETKLAEVDCQERVTFHSDTQRENTLERESVFKVAVEMKNSEAVVNHMINIGLDTDRGISYKGSQVEPTDNGEVRYLFFVATINPLEG